MLNSFFLLLSCQESNATNANHSENVSCGGNGYYHTETATTLRWLHTTNFDTASYDADIYQLAEDMIFLNSGSRVTYTLVQHSYIVPPIKHVGAPIQEGRKRNNSTDWLRRLVLTGLAETKTRFGAYF